MPVQIFICISGVNARNEYIWTIKRSGVQMSLINQKNILGFKGGWMKEWAFWAPKRPLHKEWFYVT